MKKIAVNLFLIVSLFLSCTRKSDEVCSEAHEDASPRLLAYFRPEGTKIRYKNTNGDTATLTFGPIVIGQGNRTEKKPCKTTYYPTYNQRLSTIDNFENLFPVIQTTINNSFDFAYNNAGYWTFDGSDDAFIPKTTIHINGKKYENVLIWTKSYGNNNRLNIPVDSIIYSGTNFILQFKDSTNTVWTILN